MDLLSLKQYYWLKIFFMFQFMAEGTDILCDLLQLSGFKKVLNYTKRVTEDVKYRNMVSREEVMR